MQFDIKTNFIFAFTAEEQNYANWPIRYIQNLKARTTSVYSYYNQSRENKNKKLRNKTVTM